MRRSGGRCSCRAATDYVRPAAPERPDGCQPACGPRSGEPVRPIVAGAVVVLAAAAFATVLRPGAGYTTAAGLLGALAAGAGLGIGGLVVVALTTRAVARRHDDRVSLRSAITAWPTMRSSRSSSSVLRLGRTLCGLRRVWGEEGTARKGAEQAEFLRWQETVAPIAGAYISAIRPDAVFLQGLPRHPKRRLAGRYASRSA